MARTLHDELLYGDRPARSAPQSVEERRQQLGDGVGVVAGERPLFAFDCDEREARISLLGVPAPTTHNAAERTATDYKPTTHTSTDDITATVNTTSTTISLITATLCTSQVKSSQVAFN